MSLQLKHSNFKLKMAPGVLFAYKPPYQSIFDRGFCTLCQLIEILSFYAQRQPLIREYSCDKGK